MGLCQTNICKEIRACRSNSEKALPSRNGCLEVGSSSKPSHRSAEQQRKERGRTLRTFSLKKKVKKKEGPFPLRKENQAMLLEVCSPNCYPEKAAHSDIHVCTQHVYCVTCMLVEWRQILSNEVCVRNGGCILLLSLLPLLLKSSDNHSVSGCVGSCLTSLTYHVFAGEWY